MCQHCPLCSRRDGHCSPGMAQEGAQAVPTPYGRVQAHSSHHWAHSDLVLVGIARLLRWESCELRGGKYFLPKAQVRARRAECCGAIHSINTPDLQQRRAAAQGFLCCYFCLQEARDEQSIPRSPARCWQWDVPTARAARSSSHGPCTMLG